MCEFLRVSCWRHVSIWRTSECFGICRVGSLTVTQGTQNGCQSLVSVWFLRMTQNIISILERGQHCVFRLHGFQINPITLLITPIEEGKEALSQYSNRPVHYTLLWYLYLSPSFLSLPPSLYLPPSLSQRMERTVLCLSRSSWKMRAVMRSWRQTCCTALSWP